MSKTKFTTWLPLQYIRVCDQVCDYIQYIQICPNYAHDFMYLLYFSCFLCFSLAEVSREAGGSLTSLLVQPISAVLAKTLLSSPSIRQGDPCLPLAMPSNAGKYRIAQVCIVNIHLKHIQHKSSELSHLKYIELQLSEVHLQFPHATNYFSDFNETGSYLMWKCWTVR